MRIIINESQEKKIIKEYLDKKYGNPLFKYLSMTEDEKIYDIINTFYADFYDFLQTQVDSDLYDISEEEYQASLQDVKKQINNKNFDRLINDIYAGKYKSYCNDFVNYAIRKHFTDVYNNPAWLYLEEPTLIPNDWLIHFSDNARDIAASGFQYGTNNKERTAYSGAGDILDKFGEGYNFAYTLDDYIDFYDEDKSLSNLTAKKSNTLPKYGKDAVIFRASGVRVWHNGDREYQVIFWGPVAKDFIYLNNNEGEWNVQSTKTNKVLYHSDSLEKVVNWAINNIVQYSKHIININGNKRNKNYEENYN